MIVITAPTGIISSRVLANVLASGEPVRVIARDPARLPANIRERVDIVAGSHGDSAVVERAFAAADAVFWLVPPNPLASSIDAAYVDFTRPACAAFRSHGVKRVVGISAIGRGTAVAGHAGLVTASLMMDDLITNSGVSYRALTMPSFMDNILRQVELIKTQSLFTSTIDGDLKVPTCATRDIAAAAAALLLDPAWTGSGSVPILGPADLSSDEMAQIISEVLGKPINYRKIPLDALKARLAGHGMSEAMVQGMADMMNAKNNGLDNGEQRTPQTTTPTSFRAWCEDVLKPAVLG
jgi:uncharacterized protein YbjT (DUF2867 family)